MLALKTVPSTADQFLVSPPNTGLLSGVLATLKAKGVL